MEVIITFAINGKEYDHHTCQKNLRGIHHNEKNIAIAGGVNIMQYIRDDCTIWKN